MMTEAEKRSFDLANNYDVVIARQHARELARTMGFGLTDQTRIATAVSEVARRAVDNQGSISFRLLLEGTRQGVECICIGAEWITTPAGQPTGEFLGGLRGIEKLMDEFELQTQQDGQAVVLMRKWLPSN
jgi:serine/threonine-protein kinase RsbT